LQMVGRWLVVHRAIRVGKARILTEAGVRR
jgi:hypothetical protein